MPKQSSFLEAVHFGNSEEKEKSEADAALEAIEVKALIQKMKNINTDEFDSSYFPIFPLKQKKTPSSISFGQKSLKGSRADQRRSWGRQAELFFFLLLRCR